MGKVVNNIDMYLLEYSKCFNNIQSIHLPTYTNGMYLPRYIILSICKSQVDYFSQFAFT